MRVGKRGQRGFTLVELMIVVAIIGVLAALALYGVSRYLRHAKTAEALRALGSIETGEQVQYERETPYGAVDAKIFVHIYCPDSPMMPAAVPAGAKMLVTSGPGIGYSSGGWPCLKFTMSEPQFYSYEVLQNGSTGLDARYTANARGDLDGNGQQSLFSIVGRGGAFGESARDSITIVNEDE